MNMEDYNEYYIQGSDHYLIPKYVFMELFNEMSNWKEEAKELKKQLETYEIEGYEQNEELNKMSFDIRKYKTQQKEFIKYLENESKEIYRDGGLRQNIFKQVLQKYQEIIGVSK